MTVKTTVHNLRCLPAEGLNNPLYIGRGSKWGNPYLISKSLTREKAIAGYRKWLWGNKGLMAALPELRGKQLLCFCAPQACHGHVLVKALEWHDRQANADPEEALDRAVEHERSVLNHCEDHVTDVALLLHDAC
jgi:hypothetical protein